jgi:Icc-related predicted phosphoesterase
MSLRVLFTSDFHASEELKEAAIEEANSGEYDLFVNLGDYMDDEYAEELFERIEIPGLGCTGNRDMFMDDEFLDGDVPVYNFLEANVDDEYLFILIGGDFPDEIKQKVHELVEEHGDSRKVVVGSHYPPHKQNDLIHSGRRIGFESFREIIIRDRPVLWVCGHVHEDFGESSLMDTLVLNAAADESGKAWSVTIGDEGGVESYREVELVGRESGL